MTTTIRFLGNANNSTGGIYSDYNNNFIRLSSRDQQITVGIMIIVSFLAMATEILAPELVFLIALVILMLTEILTIEKTLSGFGNESMITIGALFIVIGVVEKSHVVDWFARKAFGSKGSFFWGKARLMVTAFSLSIFFNNTPLVAILIPVVKDWARSRNEPASQLLIPLSFSVLAGSFVTMIGTSTNLTVQGLMQAERGYSFPFFAPAPIGIPLFAVLFIYQLIAGPYLLPNDKSGLIREVQDKASSFIAEVFVSEHSPAVGHSVGAMMNSLGIASSQAIKIRRKIVQNTTNSIEIPEIFLEDQRRGEAEEEANSGLKRRSRTNWFKALVDPTLTHMEYASTKAALDTNANEEYLDIVAPSHREVVNAGDIVYIASAVDAVAKMLKSVAGESLGLFILQSNVLAMPLFGTEFVECVISDTNPLIGQKMSQVAQTFPETYKAAVITVRPKNWGKISDELQHLDDILHNHNDEGNTPANAEQLVPSQKNDIADVTVGDIELVNLDSSSDSLARLMSEDQATSIVVSDHILGAGDLVLAVCPEGERDNLKTNGDFYVVSTVGSLPKPMNLYSLFPMFLFMLMLSLVAAQFITMIAATLVVTAVFFLGGWASAEDIPKLVDIRLCMLLACSISFAGGVTASGLAITIAETLTSGITSPFSNLLLMNFMTILVTELISNNAAAALMYPIAVATADKLGVDFKPFAMGVLIGSTSGFANPTGTF